MFPFVWPVAAGDKQKAATDCLHMCQRFWDRAGVRRLESHICRVGTAVGLVCLCKLFFVVCFTWFCEVNAFASCSCSYSFCCVASFQWFVALSWPLTFVLDQNDTQRNIDCDPSRHQPSVPAPHLLTHEIMRSQLKKKQQQQQQQQTNNHLACMQLKFLFINIDVIDIVNRESGLWWWINESEDLRS